MKNLLILATMVLTFGLANAQSYNRSTAGMYGESMTFCFPTKNGEKYKINFGTEDNNGKLSLFLYYTRHDINGKLTGIMSGEWIYIEENPIESSDKIVITWSGKDSGKPKTQFVVKLDNNDFSKIIGIIDDQGKTWNACRL